MKLRFPAMLLAACCVVSPLCFGQEEAGSGALNAETTRGAAEDLVDDTREKVGEFAEQVDQNPKAKEVSAGILQPIYQLAEYMAFPMFHWVAFTLMAAGVISFTLQLVLGKLVLLTRMSFNIKEILADALGLVISLTGIVLTTQAAAENSTFTTSPAAVLSSAGLGVLLGLILYWWAQKEELLAAFGRRKQIKP